jgi:hypothetical protein
MSKKIETGLIIESLLKRLIFALYYDSPVKSLNIMNITGVINCHRKKIKRNEHEVYAAYFLLRLSRPMVREKQNPSIRSTVPRLHAVRRVVVHESDDASRMLLMMRHPETELRLRERKLAASPSSG